MPETMFIQSFIDITQIFKTLNPNEKFSSLSFLCLKFLNRRLSKYEQRSNWNRRPLRKAQIHYAALDAFACVLIYEKLHPEYQELQKHGKLYKAKLAVNYVYTQKPNEAKLGEMI
jgi:ribonuclease D